MTAFQQLNRVDGRLERKRADENMRRTEQELLLIRSYENESHQTVVAVKDSGVGIPAETADRLFDAFFSTKPSGLGIGLSICRSIIGDHGGRLWATNNTGEPGATVQFVLPSHQEWAP